ncbi:ribosomal maturation YjgA family protein [Streptomyces kanasensis]|uniref:ribosomal maturation YjgA family protein n=1 Tax=Streptomyces kanasensis TaxID=936756 RepID=UPI00381ED9EB
MGARSAATGAWTTYAGDALYTVLAVALVVLVAPRLRPVAAAGAALAFSCAVELFQLTGVPAGLAAHSRLAPLVLGTSFHAPDLLWYAVGAGAGWAVHSACRRGRGPGGSGRRATTTTV